MRTALVPFSQQSVVPAGTAATWCFDRATVLVVMRGRAWITVDGFQGASTSESGETPRGGDWFLESAGALRVAARQPILVEAAGVRGEAAVLACYAEPVPVAPRGKRLTAAFRGCRVATARAMRSALGSFRA